MQKTGAQLMVELLKSHGVDLCFGYPGGAILPFYDELYKSDIRHILVRHEQGAMHMAEGYARITGKPAVVIVTSGPGATNTITGLCDAKMDSIPMLVITGQVATPAIGTDAFQEADIFGISIPVTKYNALVKHADDLANIFEEAWAMATTGRPGPVLIDFPKDVQTQKTGILRGQPGVSRRFLEKPAIKGSIEEFAAALNRAEKPLIYIGGGAVISGGSRGNPAPGGEGQRSRGQYAHGTRCFSGHALPCSGHAGYARYCGGQQSHSGMRLSSGPGGSL